MKSETWQHLLSLESRDIVSSWHKKLHGRELSTQRIREITSSAKQAREFFRNAKNADISVRPLLSFYGVASLSRSTMLVLKRGSGEASLTRSHGVETLNWTANLSGDISSALSNIGLLRICTTPGLFNDFLISSRNMMTLHVFSSSVDWGIAYPIPAIRSALTLSDLLSRIPGLISPYDEIHRRQNFSRVEQLSYSSTDGFYAKVQRSEFTHFVEAYRELGYTVNDLADLYELSAPAQVFNDVRLQFVQGYLEGFERQIPSLFIAKALPDQIQLSQLAITYLLSFTLGMLTRYFPTQWVSLASAEKGDSLWPAINAAQNYVDTVYPDLIVELLHYFLDNGLPSEPETR